MNPGIELDKLIAEKVMGWTEVEIVQVVSGGPQLQGVKHGTIASQHTSYKPKLTIPKYSTDIAAAWEVVEKLESQYYFDIRQVAPSNDQVRVEYLIHVSDRSLKVIAEVFSKTAQRGICLAALKVIE